MKRTLVAIAAASAAATVGLGSVAAGSREVAPTTTVGVGSPLAAPTAAGPMTVTLVEAHYSTAASQLVVVLEITAVATVEPRGHGAVYVGPDGQQVEVADYIEPDEVFAGATALSVMVFPAATPGGTVMYYAYADSTKLDVSIPVPWPGPRN